MYLFDTDPDKDKYFSKMMILHSDTGGYINMHLYHIITDSLGNIKQAMGKAKQLGEDPHLAKLAYRVTPRGMAKLSPAEAMTQHKLRALLPIKQNLFAQLTMSREVMLQQTTKAEHYNHTTQQLQ